MVASCDTMFTTVGGGRFLIFGKNSDRPPNEACQIVKYKVSRSTYLRDQIPLTHCIITSSEIEGLMEDFEVHADIVVVAAKPGWMFGAEMAANSAGVCIGNEALFVKPKFLRGEQQQQQKKKDNRHFLGMDHLRLVVERTHTAKDAVRLLTRLIEHFGQDGVSTHPQHGRSLEYQNSYIVTGYDGAYCVETIGRHWLCREFRFDQEESRDVAYSISNSPTLIGPLGDDMTCSEGFVEWAISVGLCSSQTDLNFSESVRDRLVTFAIRADERRCTTIEHMLRMQAEYKRDQSLPGSVHAMMNALRHHHHHHGHPVGYSSLDGSIFHHDVCMHASWGPARISQTCNSMVVVLDRHNFSMNVFLTGTSSPCISMFKRVSMSCESVPDWPGHQQMDTLGPCEELVSYNPRSAATLWWRSERLQRMILLANEVLAQSSDQQRVHLQPIKSILANHISTLRQHEKSMIGELLGSEKRHIKWFQMHEQIIDETESDLSKAMESVLDTMPDLSLSMFPPWRSLRAYLHVRQWMFWSRSCGTLTLHPVCLRLERIFLISAMKAILPLVTVVALMLLWRLIL